MKRLYHSSTVKVSDAGNIRIKHKELFLSDKMKKATEKVVTDARWKVTRTVALLNLSLLQDTVKANFSKYFKSGATPTANELNDVKSILELIMNGINADVSIKVRKVNSSILKPNQKHLKDRVEGYVTRRNGSKGDVHVVPSYVESNSWQATRVFIHEASHKYADTLDYGEKGYMFSDGSDFRQPGIVADQCRKNADSFAYFCMAVG
jgi:hypothetical protein